MSHASVSFAFDATDAVSCGFINPSSLADKHFCPTWKRGKTEVQRNAFLKAFKGDL